MCSYLLELHVQSFEARFFLLVDLRDFFSALGLGGGGGGVGVDVKKKEKKALKMTS